MSTLRVFEAFAGYGSQAMALERLLVDHEVVGISEIDKYAIQAYEAVHGKTRNYGDICKIDWSEVPDFDLFTYSFPCQDISFAGMQRGLEEGSGTRSSLLWECRRAIEAKKPKYLLMENVKALTSKKFKPYLEAWLEELSLMGYKSYVKVLNAKNYGVPQNRERVFAVSILGEHDYVFPEAFPLEKRLKDVLEEKVDEKYWLTDRWVSGIVRHCERKKSEGCGFDYHFSDGNDVSHAITTAYVTRQTDTYIDTVRACRMCGRDPDNPTSRKGGTPTVQMLEIGGTVSNCITTVQKDSLVAEPKSLLDEEDERLGNLCVEVRYKGKELLEGDGLYLSTSQDFFHGGLSGLSRTLRAVKHDAGVVQNWRIRRLTPRECFRLMGVSENDIDKIQSAGISNTQQYKMAGNSIVVDVLYHIFNQMFKDTDYLIDILE